MNKVQIKEPTVKYIVIIYVDHEHFFNRRDFCRSLSILFVFRKARDYV